MGVLSLSNGDVWGASGASIGMLLRFSAKHAEGSARRRIEAAEQSGLGLHLELVDDEVEQRALEEALRLGIRDMTQNLEGVLELVAELNNLLGPKEDSAP